MYQFSDELRNAYESLMMPLAIYQVIDGKVVTILVSDGFCQLKKDTREHLTSSLTNSMFERVDPAYAGKLAKQGAAFTNHESKYDVVYRSNDVDGKSTLIHAVGHWQTMPDGTKLAFLHYLDLTASVAFINEESQKYHKKQEEYFYIDPLTKLPNVNYLHEFGEEKIEAIRLNKNKPLLLFFDVCVMQNYNDQYGYKAGDELLKLTANILKTYYPNSFITRNPDDHFIALTKSTPYDEMITKTISDEIIKKAEGNTLGIKAGLCLITPDDNIYSGIEHARRALKTIGNDRNIHAVYYSSAIELEYQRRQFFIDHFDDALKNHYIQVYYHRIVNSQSQAIVSHEALARWIDPGQGFISPGEFIPILTKYHLTYKWDLYVVEQVCKDIQQRKAARQPLNHVSINLSAQDFDHQNMFKSVNDILKKYHIPVSMITIEITEQDIAQASDYFNKQLNAFFKHGYTIWVDDFGSGYSNLNILTRYHFHLIKIDQSFIRDLCENHEANKVIIQAIIASCQKLGIHTLCEGVETEKQYQFVKEAGVDYIQGFYFYKPVPLTEF